jgi:probable rRNA maturation factor
MNLEVDIEIEEGYELPLGEDEIVFICEHVLTDQEVERDCYVSLTVTSNDEIQRLNSEWRGIDRPTDVISLECDRPDDPDLFEGEPAELGDIVLAPDFIRGNALRLGVAYEDELRLLIVHGMLHLLGYDHLDDEEAEVMEASEDEILSRIACDRTVSHVDLTRHRDGDAQ